MSASFFGGKLALSNVSPPDRAITCHDDFEISIPRYTSDPAATRTLSRMATLLRFRVPRGPLIPFVDSDTTRTWRLNGHSVRQVENQGLTPVALEGRNQIPASFGAFYDTRGNLLTYGGETLTYDAGNRQTKDLKSSITWQYLYSGGDERLVRAPASAPSTVPRREIARYIVQGKPFTPYSGSCSESSLPFLDVHCTDPDFAYIKTVLDQGLTAGCGGGNYCPDTATTRGQAAVLFMKAEHGGTYSPTCLGTYVDAPCSDPTSAFVEVAITEQVLFICSSGHACPANSITEADAVKGMADGNLWASYKPIAGGSLYTLRDNENRLVTEFADSLPSRDDIYIGNVAVASYLGKQPGSAGSWRFHSVDHLGTIRLTVDAATGGSSFLEQPKYWPYGDLLTPVTPPLQRVGFAAMERDTENNHFYDHARHHDFNLGRFVSPDRVQGKIPAPQTWNRYAYALNNPAKYIDPDGQATAGFTGFSNATGPGVSSIVHDLNGAPGIGAARLFDWQDVKGAVAFLEAEHRAHPNDAIVVVGHSFGADSAMKTAEELGKQNVKVNQLITIDPVTMKYATSNVESATNYYQTTNRFLGGSQVYGGLNTHVESVEIQGVGHTMIDDVLGDSGAVARQLREQALQRMPTSCGDPNFVGPCQR